MKKKWFTSPGMRILSIMLGVAVLAAALQIRALANPDFADLERSCTLTVRYPYEAEDTLSSSDSVLPEPWRYDMDPEGGQPVVRLDLYKVADAKSSNRYDTYSFSVLDGFKENDKLKELPDWIGAADRVEEDSTYWDEMAQEAAKTALVDKKAEPVVTGYQLHMGSADDSSLNTITKLNDGTELGSGLYLLVPRGIIDTGVNSGDRDERVIPGADYRMVDKDGDGTEETIVTYAYSKRYVYTFSPQLVSLPGRTSEGYQDNTGADAEWDYDVEIELKMERAYRYGDLRIIKELLVHDTIDPLDEVYTDPCTFVFQIDAVLYGQNADGTENTQKTLWERSWNKAIHFTEAGSDDILIEHIPACSHITVTEVYSGAKYEFVADDNGDSTDMVGNLDIDADDEVKITYQNIYDRTESNGYGVTNHFEDMGEFGHSGTEGSGRWQYQEQPLEPGEANAGTAPENGTEPSGSEPANE